MEDVIKEVDKTVPPGSRFAVKLLLTFSIIVGTLYLKEKMSSEGQTKEALSDCQAENKDIKKENDSLHRELSNRDRDERIRLTKVNDLLLSQDTLKKIVQSLLKDKK